MNRITEKYERENKDALIAEVQERIIEGRTITVADDATKADIVAALELDDEAKAKESTRPLGQPKQSIAAVAIPKVQVAPLAEVACPNPPTDDQFTALAKRRSDGLQYAIAFHEPDTYGKTVTAKNSANFLQLNDAEFRDQFDKQ